MNTLRTSFFPLWFKLTAAFLLVVLVGVGAVSLLTNQVTTSSFRHFMNAEVAQEWDSLPPALAAYYARQGNWQGVEAVLTAVSPGHGQGGMSLVLLDDQGTVVASVGGMHHRPTSAEEAMGSLPVWLDGAQIGTLLMGMPGGGMGMNMAGEQFLAEVNRAIVWGGVMAAGLALGLGIMLARYLTRPLRQLTQATHQLAVGHRLPQIPVNTNDELGELTGSFNQMAHALATAEQQRQQLLADVAHELRTPLSVMRSQLEAMLDGVFPLTAENLAVAHEETLLLGRLVEDLRTLSLAESGQLPLQKTAVSPHTLFTQLLAAFAPLAETEGVHLTADIPANLPTLTADAGRIQQVMGNLLTNALRHACQENGKPPQVQVIVTSQANALQVAVCDNGPGLSPEAQSHVFDRFWRADTARSRDQGGSGLGLAICRAIVTAHNGRIWVTSQPGQGATFTFTLPT